MKTELTDAELVKTVRKQLGLTQAAFAEKMGFTGQAYISRLERGEKNLSRPARKLIEIYLRKIASSP